MGDSEQVLELDIGDGCKHCCHPKIGCFDMLIVLTCKHLKESGYRKNLSLNCLYLVKDRFSERNSVGLESLPGNASKQGR